MGKAGNKNHSDAENTIIKPHYIKCGPVPVIRDWRKLPTSKLTRGERNCRFIETYCVIPEGDDVGKPVKLAPFQERFFIAVYDNPHVTDTAILSIARKNAKTGTIAFLDLLHIVGPEAVQNSRIESGAMSRKQAAEVFNYASKCIMLSDKLRPLCKIVPSTKIIVGIPMNVSYQAISADADTAHGGSPVVAIIDEAGRVKGPSSDFVDAIATSQGAYKNPLMIYISTQAPTAADMLSVLIDDAEKNQPTKTVCHVYAAPEDCDLMDEEAWAMANPALGLFRSIEDVRKSAEKASRMPSFESAFRNLYLNQRISTETLFVSRNVWEENGAEPSSLKGRKVFGGLDLSAVSDLTALELVSEDGDVASFFWLPKEGLIEKAKQDRVPYDVWEKQGHLLTTPGKAIEYEYVAHQLKKLFDEYDIEQINFDRFAMKFLLPWLKKAGLTDKQIEKFKEMGQGMVSMSPALRELESRLLQKKLKHGMHPVLTMCAGNAVVEMDAAGNRKFTKRKSTGRIDGLVSLAMAVDALARYEEGKDDQKWSMHFV